MESKDKLLQAFGCQNFDEFDVKFGGLGRQFWVILEALEAIFAPLGTLEAPLGHLGTPEPS